MPRVQIPSPAYSQKIKLKILLFLNSKSKGGLEIYFLKNAFKLKEKGINISLFINKKSDLNTKDLSKINLKDALYNKWDIVHFYRSQDIIFSRILRAKRFFFTNMMGLSISKRDLYHKFLYKKIYKIFAISESVKRELEENLPLEKDKIILLYPGVDVNYFKKDENLRKNFREMFSISEKEIVISNTSRFEEKKGQKELIMVFKELSEKYKNIKLFLQGMIEDENYFKEIKKIAPDNVYFLNFSPDTRPLLCASDIYVFPSYSEALGFSLIEAMSTQLPCVAFDKRAIPEIIEDNVSGFLVKFNDLKDLKEKIEILIKDKDLREKIGLRAREKVLEKFNIDKYIELLIQFYKNL